MNILSKILLAGLPLIASEARSHALWAEPADGGFKIFFGEPGEGLREKKEKLAKLGSIKAWDAAGKEVKGTVLAEDHLLVPVGGAGITASALEADLYGKGDEAGKPYFHVRFIADPAKKIAPTKGAPVEILPDGPIPSGSKDSVSFLVLKGGKPFMEENINMVAPGGWSKSYKTDAQGKIRMETPWAGLYVLEVGFQDKAPGTFNGKAYSTVYHASTLGFVKN